MQRTLRIVSVTPSPGAPRAKPGIAGLAAAAAVRDRLGRPTYYSPNASMPLARLLCALAAVAAAGALMLAAGPTAPAGAADNGRLAWRPSSAANYLDARIETWRHGMGALDHGTFCISCHTGLPYAMARPGLDAALGQTALTAAETDMLGSVRTRVRLCDQVQPFLSGPEQSRGTEAVLNVVALASYDHGRAGFDPDLRKALDTLWSRQITSGPGSGSWPWFSLGNEPWEAPDSQYWGAAVAAETVGRMSTEYVGLPGEWRNIVRLEDFLRREAPKQSLLNRLALLSAAVKLKGLISPAQEKAIAQEALAKQHADGGWSVSDLILPTWKRNDGTPQPTMSDGYATGLLAYTLEQAGLPGTEHAIQAGRQWLTKRQNPVTGAWSAFSVNKNRDPSSEVGKFMTDAATAYAVLALTYRPASPHTH